MLRIGRCVYTKNMRSSAIGNVEEPIRLCSSNLSQIQGLQDITIPSYNRQSVQPGILNLGLRDFHRVHNAVYFDKLLHIPGNKSWGLLSVGTDDSHKKSCSELRLQNGLYTVVSKRPDGNSKLRVVGSILDCFHAQSDSRRASELISGNDIRIVTLTIKESNYFFDRDFTRLNLNHPSVHHDLMTAGSSKPIQTPVGMLVAGLYGRYKKKGHPLTVLSCDNLIRNGEITRVMVETYALHKYPLETDFHRWISTSVFYPNTMCDRICLTDPFEDRIAIQQLLGIRDNALLTTESFKEWVVEKWMGNKPDGLEEVGIKMVGSTVPYENLKIRLNYGTRLSVGIIAKALGYHSFEEALEDKSMKRFATQYMTEVEPGLGQTPSDITIDEYKGHILERMSTKQLKYQTHRVVEDASKKLKMDWQPVLQSLPAGSPMRMIGFTIATWAHLLSESALARAHGSEIMPVVDVGGESLERMAKNAIANPSGVDSEKAVNDFLSHVFANGLTFLTPLTQEVLVALRDFEKYGIKETLVKVCN